MSHTKDLIDEVTEKIPQYLKDKYDQENKEFENFDFFKPQRRTHINKFAEKFGIHVTQKSQWSKLSKKLSDLNYSNFDKLSCFQFYTLASRNPELFDEFYDILEDENSKKDYDWFVKYRTAYAFLSGAPAYTLFTPRITKEMHQKFESQIKSKDGYFEIDGFLLKNDKGVLVAAFFIEQYRLSNLVEPIKGDVVLDIGAFFGDTAFWFKKYVGDEGKVYAFEPVGYNFNVLKENIERNKAANIIPQKLALSDKEGELSISGGGGQSSISSNGTEKAKVTTIDKFVEDQKLDRVDFIKMDIEGAELDALRGGQETIKKFKPKLAICVYHKGDDLITIPKYIKSINNNYKFFMKHNTSGWGDTVLYCK